jgi:hypothetical protein
MTVVKHRSTTPMFKAGKQFIHDPDSTSTHRSGSDPKRRTRAAAFLSDKN